MAKEYIDFISDINHKLGINLSYYKQTQMKRRITSLRNKHGFNCFSTYYQALNKEDELLKEFIDRITINVSEFYRNPKRWDVLKNSVFPHLINHNKNRLKIWSAACSTGEEAYSLALMITEYFPTLNYQILATDIDETVLNKARKGIYHEKVLRELPLNIKNKYFTKTHGLYTIDQKIKQFITFQTHNLLSDHYPRNVDLIVCRNVLIYFTDEAKEMIYHNFNGALGAEGILFVGSTEQIFNPNKYGFSAYDTFFYQKSTIK